MPCPLAAWPTALDSRGDTGAGWEAASLIGIAVLSSRDTWHWRSDGALGSRISAEKSTSLTNGVADDRGTAMVILRVVCDRPSFPG